LSEKNELKPWQKKMWCIPPKHNGEFVFHMENVLEVYQRPYDLRYPVICMDELSKQLTSETQVPLKAKRGRSECFDYEYVRNGTANVFAFTEPLTGWRHIAVTDQRTKIDWAYEIRKLVDVHFPNAERITLVMDNLNTHSLGSLYEAFAPQEARRLVNRIEVVHTPKHGSWLNMAEIELNVLTRQCLARWIPDKQTLINETTAWQNRRNHKTAKIDWQFTADNARIKLKHLYPKNQN
jgi:DDE superfamily endonuclease